MQTAFPFLTACADPKPAPDGLLARITSDVDAIRVSIRASGLKQAYIAKALGVSAPYLSLIRNGKRPLPERLTTPFCYLTGQLLLKQYRDLQAALRAIRGGGETDRIAALATELRMAA